jgi:predicted glycosyltransferase
LHDLGYIEMLHPDSLTPLALSEWMSRSLAAPPSVQSRFNWDGLKNLPRLMDELMAELPARASRHSFDCEVPACYEPTASVSATL